MSTTYEKLTSNRAKLTFEVAPEEFEKGMQAAYRKLVGQINIPGFRRGKAPRKIIENLYGESVFYEDAFESIFPDVYEEAIKEHDIVPVDEPQVELGEIGGGKPLTFSLEVYVKPDVKLGEYKGLTAPKLSAEVKDEMVAERLEQARERIARWVNVERAVENGDRVTIDYLGKVDDVAFAGGEAEGFVLEIGSSTFIPGFEEQIIGMAIDEEKDISVTFPEDYRAEDLKGKDAVFHVKVHDIKEKELPELDDEFAMDVSEFDTLDEYKADIRSKLEKEAKQQAESARDNALVDALVEACEIDVPTAMVNRETDQMLRDMQMRMMMQGLSLDQYMQITGMNINMIRAQQAGMALSRVKGELALEAIREQEGLEAAEEEIQKQMERLAEESGQSVEEFKEPLTEQQLEFVESAAVTEKVLQLLRDHANYIDPEEYDKLMEEKHAHDHDHDHDHEHVHGPDCDHDHDHDHGAQEDETK